MPVRIKNLDQIILNVNYKARLQQVANYLKPKIRKLFERLYGYSPRLNPSLDVVKSPRISIIQVEVTPSYIKVIKRVIKLFKGVYDFLRKKIGIDEEIVKKNGYELENVVTHELEHNALGELLEKYGLSIGGILRKYKVAGRNLIEGWTEYLKQKTGYQVNDAYAIFADADRKLVKKHGDEYTLLENFIQNPKRIIDEHEKIVEHSSGLRALEIPLFS